MGEIPESVPSVNDREVVLAKIFAGKDEMRKELAQRPMKEKLAMLDALRDRMITLREAGNHPPCDPKDEPRWYRQKPEDK